MQGAKYRFSEYGFRYSLDQTFNFVTMTDVKAGDNGDAQDARHSLGSITDPTSIWSSHNGVRIPELAWQQSLRDGDLVAVAGMVSQRNYFDGNAYAHTGCGQFMNSAPVHSLVLPFVARAGGPTEGGLCFNLQQQLGADSPLGWFGRFGWGGSQVTSGASAQAGTGLVLQAPLKHAGLFPRLSNDLLGLGFFWSQPSATAKTVFHENGYGLEAFYTLQLSPLLRLQPDVQLIWNPAFNPNPGPAVVGQLQVILSW